MLREGLYRLSAKAKGFLRIHRIDSLWKSHTTEKISLKPVGGPFWFSILNDGLLKQRTHRKKMPEFPADKISVEISLMPLGGGVTAS